MLSFSLVAPCDAPGVRPQPKATTETIPKGPLILKGAWVLRSAEGKRSPRAIAKASNIEHLFAVWEYW